MKPPNRDHPEHASPQDLRTLGDRPTELFDPGAAPAGLPQTTGDAAPEKAAMKDAPQARPPQAIPAASERTRLIIPPGLDRPAAQPSGHESGATPAQGPAVGFLVVIEGPGRGAYRAVYGGSNTIGRSANQRIPIDFGDETISAEQQAFLVYDGKKRQFQLVPNLSRPNLVHLNDAALLTNTQLEALARITMGRTTLLFVPVCGPDFDWVDLA